MYDLVSYKEAKIESLAEQIKQLTLQNEMYATYIFELISKECPEEYKQVIKSELLKLNR